MELIQTLENGEIDVNELTSKLKLVGLSLNQFNKCSKDQIESLIDVFKKLMEVTPNTQRAKKLELRSRLEKVIKEQKKNNSNAASTSVYSESSVSKRIESKPIFKFSSKEKLNVQSTVLGTVKFFLAENGYGFISNYFLTIDYFVHINNCQCSTLYENEIVIFETRRSKKKPEELEAVNVSNKIPLFIFNKDSRSGSFAYSLVDGLLEKEIFLTEKYDTGFACVNATVTRLGWKITNLEFESIEISEITPFCKKVLAKFLLNLNECKTAVEWLIKSLQGQLKKSDLSSICIEAVNILEQQSILEIEKQIRGILGIDFFEPFLSERKTTFNKISFVLWGQDILTRLPRNNFEIEKEFWDIEVLPLLDRRKLANVITALFKEEGASDRVNHILNCYLREQFVINTKEQMRATIAYLKPLVSAFPDLVLNEVNYKCYNNSYYVELYNHGLINKLSETRIKSHIDELRTSDAKSKFIESLSAAEILNYYSFYPSLAQYREKYVAKLLDEAFSKIHCVCFDLESDGASIKEFAWKTPKGGKSHFDFETVNDGISALIQTLASGALVIGQNINEFDLPILANYGAIVSSDVVWDTLEIEMLLNPTRFSYGLKTLHDAVSDTVLTYELFKNQVSRIISLENGAALKALLPQKAVECIDAIRLYFNLEIPHYSHFEEQSNDFYRPNPTNQSISANTLQKLTEALTGSEDKIVVAPEFLWNTLSYQFDLSFYSEGPEYKFCLSKEKIESLVVDDKLLKGILLRFVEYYRSNGRIPFAEHLPKAIGMKLSSEQALAICDNISVDLATRNSKPICFKPTDLEIAKKHLNRISETKIVVVGHELYELTSKTQLGHDFDFATILDRLKDEPIWLQMSGGKSIISLERRHCEQLGISTLPEFIKNIWLEKIGKGVFKVWCNHDFKAIINALSGSEVIYVDWVDEKIIKPT